MRETGKQMELAMKISLKMLSAAVLVAAPLSYLSAQPTTPVGAIGTADSTSAERGLTRAEVRADLAMWKRAGMDEFWNKSETPDFTAANTRGHTQSMSACEKAANTNKSWTV